MVGTAGFEPATPCSQSQIGQDCDLRRERTLQVEESLALTVTVRWEPARTAVNGTLVARPARMTWYDRSRRLRLGRKVRTVLSNYLSRWQAAKAARQLGERPRRCTRQDGGLSSWQDGP
jgi:hypothetical protein